MIKLRRLQEKDAPFMIEWMHDPEIQQCFRKDMKHMSPEQVKDFCTRAYLKNDIEEGGALHYAIVDDCDDEYLGTISLKNISLRDRSAEYAIATRKCAHGKGIAAEATRLILKEGFNNRHLHRIYLNVLHDNVRAIKFYEKCGFRYEGEFAEAVYMPDSCGGVESFKMVCDSGKRNVTITEDIE